MDNSNGPKIIKFWSYKTGESYEVTPDGEIMKTKGKDESEPGMVSGQPNEEIVSSSQDIAPRTQRTTTSPAERSEGNNGQQVSSTQDNFTVPPVPRTASMLLRNANAREPFDETDLRVAIDQVEMDNLLNYDIEYSYGFYVRYWSQLMQNKRRNNNN